MTMEKFLSYNSEKVVEQYQSCNRTIMICSGLVLAIADPDL